MESPRSSCIDKEEEEKDEQHRNAIVLAICIAAIKYWCLQMSAVITYLTSSKSISRKRNRDREQAQYVLTLTSGRDHECISKLRLNITSFELLCSIMRNRGLLHDTCNVKVEQVATFLHTMLRTEQIVCGFLDRVKPLAVTFMKYYEQLMFWLLRSSNKLELIHLGCNLDLSYIFFHIQILQQIKSTTHFNLGYLSRDV